MGDHPRGAGREAPIASGAAIFVNEHCKPRAFEMGRTSYQGMDRSSPCDLLEPKKL